MPATIKPGVRISVVDAVIRFVFGKSPFDIERRGLWAGWRHNPIGIDLCSEGFFDDAIWLVGNSYDHRISLQDGFQPLLD